MAENSLTSEQINQIYQSACAQNIEEFKNAVKNIDPKLSQMVWCFYREIATNNLDMSLMDEHIRFNQDERAKNVEANLKKWLEKHKQETGYYTIN